MNTSEIFLIAVITIFTVPYLIWRVANTEQALRWRKIFIWQPGEASVTISRST
jgi:hypothetical protein